jgi:hypothetical protein
MEKVCHNPCVATSANCQTVAILYWSSHVLAQHVSEAISHSRAPPTAFVGRRGSLKWMPECQQADTVHFGRPQSKNISNLFLLSCFHASTCFFQKVCMVGFNFTFALASFHICGSQGQNHQPFIDFYVTNPVQRNTLVES